MKLEYI